MNYINGYIHDHLSRFQISLSYLQYVPSNKFITKHTIDEYSNSSTPDIILNLFIYFMMTFPDIITHKLKSYHDLTINLADIFNDIPNNSVVLAPGDSPSKIVAFWRLLDPNNERNIKIIDFPLSLKSTQNKNLIYTEELVRDIINHYSINSDTYIVYIDYFHEGQTYNTIINIFRSKFIMPGWIFSKVINIADIIEETDLDLEVFVGSESYDGGKSRCIQKYTLDNFNSRNYLRKLDSNDIYYKNVTRCNIFILFLYLSYTNQIYLLYRSYLNMNLFVKESYKKDIMALIGDFVTITYLDVVSNELIRDTFIITLSDFNTIQFNIYDINEPIEKLLLQSKLQILNIDVKNVYKVEYNNIEYNKINSDYIIYNLNIKKYDYIELDYLNYTYTGIVKNINRNSISIIGNFFGKGQLEYYFYYGMIDYINKKLNK